MTDIASSNVVSLQAEIERLKAGPLDAMHGRAQGAETRVEKLETIIAAALAWIAAPVSDEVRLQAIRSILAGYKDTF